MNKSSHFTGQPIFSQLIKFVPRSMVNKISATHQADRYCKRFDCWHHLVSMLFACYGNCSSLREITIGMHVLEGKLLAAGVKYFPKRATFSDANKRRDAQVFADIYYALRKQWKRFLPDSYSNEKNIHIIDSTTISLFQEIFRGSGLSKSNGKRKGGLKIHMALQEHDSTPNLIHITDGAVNDMIFLPYLNLLKGSILIMDRGYRNYQKYAEWTNQQVTFITRHRPYTYTRFLYDQPIDQQDADKGVLADEIVELGHPAKKNRKVTVRLITFFDRLSNRLFEFITNDQASSPAFIAALYKKRWGIELLFKRLKQNMPLKYFLGDNQNAIKIQIFCALISDLLLQIVQKLVQRKWAFSNITSLIRLHLFNYVNLISFLNNPEKCKIVTYRDDYQLRLNLSG